MANTEEITRITTVMKGTPMGELMRSYWLPALMSDELPDPDGTPKAIRLLGEDLVAFRDTSGRVGIMDLHCPHRGASLALGRNEAGGLRCLYHGWKLDAQGNVLETPCEPESSRFKQHVTQLAYPTQEAGGLVWVYMGPAETTPPLPSFNWMTLPDTHRSIGKLREKCNFVQSLEGVMDSFHTNLLHSGFDVLEWTDEKIAEWWRRPSRATYGPIFAEETDYGFHYGAVREPTQDADRLKYVRVTEFVFPFFCMNPPDLGGSSRPFFFVPIDDHQTFMYEVMAAEEGTSDGGAYRRGVNHEEHLRRATLRVGEDLFDDYSPKRNLSNNYGQDRELMKKREHLNSYSGIDAGVQVQDLAMIETMGVISDRSREHLGSSDLGVIHFRRRLVAALNDFMASGKRPAIDPPLDYEHVRACSALLERDEDWRTAAWTASHEAAVQA